ncbi:enoyl-CoA hydratase/isomerase family protein [Amycolatopsis pithecellobii]|uniref:enoyl-CoA hydratase/isomerase family protein n=1 Tax=Amycolatopsis pithecellobii TaxID=664692 RepID=UPI00140D50B1|nr:enoyl-CoA hydratase/isomerase family protein [Amycolatopsis pithecellobii]
MSEENSSSVRWSVEGRLGRITIGAQGGLSTEDTEFGRCMSAAVRALSDDRAVRAVVLRSAGRVFCAGLDLEQVPGLADARTAQRLLRELNAGFADLAELPKPVVAAVDGAAFGGGANLARACDFIVASEKATFCEAFVRIGLASDVGSLYTLVRRVGHQRARELLMTGRVVGAEEALRIGAVDEVVASDRLEQRADELAGSLADGPPLAMAAIKAGLARSGGMGLRESLALEMDLQATQFASQDFHGAVAAFREKRPFEFDGR